MERERIAQDKAFPAVLGIHLSPLIVCGLSETALPDPRSTIHDPRSTIHDPRSTIHDLWSLVSGLWSLVSDSSPTPHAAGDKWAGHSGPRPTGFRVSLSSLPLICLRCAPAMPARLRIPQCRYKRPPHSDHCSLGTSSTPHAALSVVASAKSDGEKWARRGHVAARL